MRIKKKKGQITLEFISLVFVAFVFFAGMSSVIVSRMKSERMRQRAWEANSINEILLDEINNAGKADGNYSREFYLPSNILGYKYNISIISSNVIKLTYKDFDYYKLTAYKVEGQPRAGMNRIIKINNSIILN